MKNRLQAKLKQHKKNSTFRALSINSCKPELDFSSNDYLGLARASDISNTLAAAALKYGASSSAAQTIGGYSQAHAELNHLLQNITGAEDSCLFSSGYLANIATISALSERNGYVYLDRQAHASQIAGCNVAKTNIIRFKHCTPDNLFKKYKNPGLIVSDSVFSMNGNIAPVIDLLALSKEIVLDDAHGFGIIGPNHLGVLDEFNLNPNLIAATVITFGKAIGTCGAAVVGNKTVIDVIRHSSAFLFTTAPAPYIAKATTHALQLIQDDSWRHQQLQENIKTFKDTAKKLELNCHNSITPIQFIKGLSITASLDLAHKLAQKGIKVQAIRPPTVSANSVGLRITLTTLHRPKNIKYLLEQIHEFT